MSNMELPFVLAYEPEYEDKVARLSKEEFFSLFEHLNAAPRWVNSGGKRAIQILGLCHHGENHSALFDPETLKVNCFSACGGGMMLHTWVMRALDLSSPYYSRKAIEKWIDGQGLDLAHRAPRGGLDFSFYEKPFDPNVEIEMVKGIDPTIIRDLYSGFDTTRETLSRLVWCKSKEQGGDGIPVEQLEAFQVAYNPKRKTIILPHHNANGEIVGLYERNFAMLRQEAKERFPDFSPKDLVQFPTAKYFPLFKGEKYRKSGKPCWSFPNSQNLYGLHKAKEAIRETGRAIIFEGAKSVMLAHAYGYPYAVATHTFGAHTNHIAMLMQAGAKEIILAFDKQYEDCKSKEWELFEMKTKGLAERVGAHVAVSRVCDKTGLWLDYQYFRTGAAPLPYSGEIPDGNYEFTIDFEKDVEIVAAPYLKEEMRQYNAENNAAHNKDMGRRQTEKRFEQLEGDAWTTQEIYAQGFSRKTLDKFVEHGLIERVKRGHYVRKSV